MMVCCLGLVSLIAVAGTGFRVVSQSQVTCYVATEGQRQVPGDARFCGWGRKFVDPAHDDFRLKPDSPAIRLGFVPIDTQKIGIRHENQSPTGGIRSRKGGNLRLDSFYCTKAAAADE